MGTGTDRIKLCNRPRLQPGSTGSKMRRTWIAAVAVLLLSPPAMAQAEGFEYQPPGGGPDRDKLHYRVRAFVSEASAIPGQPFYVAVELTMDEGWTYYSPDPGDPMVEPKRAALTVSAPDVIVGEPLWPKDKAHFYPDEGKTRNVYEGRIVVYVPVTVRSGAGVGGQISVKAVLEGAVCGTGRQCIDLRDAAATVKVTVVEGRAVWQGQPVFAGLKEAVTASELKALHAAQATRLSAGQASQPAKAGTAPREGAGAARLDLSVWAGLGMALLAGLLLNIMPCVLPVIPLKVLGLVSSAGESRRRFVTLGLAFAGGIMLFFAGLGVVNIVLRVVAQTVFRWGEHFQSSGFRVAMALLVTAMAANLFGLFTVTAPGRWIGRVGGGAAGPGETHLTAMGAGVLTAVLSTPCSFAILTTALAWAQRMPVWLGTTAILLIGVGMAAPYAILTAFPGLVRKLPRPGRWMEIFKQSMGFLLLLVAIWLVSTLGGLAYPLWVAGYGVVLAFCLWMWGGWVRFDAPAGRRYAVRAVAVVLAVAGGFWMLRPPGPPAVAFEPFDEGRIAAARKAGRVVLVDFTASWCLTCRTVEALVYDDPDVAAELQRRGVLAVKGDISTRDLPANRMLYDELGEPGVPVTVIFPPGDSPPIRLPGLFGKDDLLRALQRAAP